MRSGNCTDTFSPRTHIRNTIREKQVSLRKNSNVQKCCVQMYRNKTYCCYERKSNKSKFRSKGLNKRTLEDCGGGPMSKYHKVLDEPANETSNNRGFRTVHHGVATY